MTKWSPTQRALTGVLALAVVGWGVDALLRDGTPRSAQAAPAAGAALPAPPEAENSAELVERLLSDKYTPVGAELERLERDLFVPTDLIRAATVPEPEPDAQALDPAAPPVGEAFVNSHVLTGVIIGHTPLAQVDERLLPLGAVLDGHKLVEIQRDFVLFEQADTQERVALQLKQRSSAVGKTP